MELTIYDTGDNKNFKIIVGDKVIDDKNLIGYELKRSATEDAILVLKYKAKVKKIVIKK